MVRPYFLAKGDALDRRRLQELFLWVANRLNELSPIGIKDKQFNRTNFNLNAWEEYQSDYVSQVRFLTPAMGYSLPGCAVDLTCDDSFMEGIIDWSIAIEPSSVTGSNMIMAVPTLCGIPVFAGEDWYENDQLITYTLTPGIAVDPDATDGDDAFNLSTDDGTVTGNPYGISLGNSVGFTGLNGRGRVGILVYSIGSFKVKACAVAVRKVLR